MAAAAAAGVLGWAGRRGDRTVAWCLFIWCCDVNYSVKTCHCFALDNTRLLLLLLHLLCVCLFLQVSGWQGARELHSDHGSVVVYRGMIDCFTRTVREEGFQALFKVCDVAERRQQPSSAGRRNRQSDCSVRQYITTGSSEGNVRSVDA